MSIDTDRVKLKTGETTSVILEGLATAGFEWNYTTDNKDCIKVTREFALSDPDSKKMGTSAKEIFTIMALKKGNVNIHFFQKRSWEKNTEPANEKKMKIIIG